MWLVRKSFGDIREKFTEGYLGLLISEIFQWLLWMEPSENTKRGWLARFALCNQSRPATLWPRSLNFVQKHEVLFHLLYSIEVRFNMPIKLIFLMKFTGCPRD